MTKKQQYQLALADRHLRLIAQLCRSYWRSLPAHVQVYLDLEELIGDTVLVVVKSSHKYDDNRGAETNFVHWVAESHLRNTLTKYKQPKRTATEVVPIEDWNGGSTPASHLGWLEAKGGVERVLQFASESLREALSRFFTERKISVVPKDCLDELRGLVHQQNVSRDDFAAVLRVL